MAGASRNIKIAGITFSIPVETTDIQTFEGGEIIKEYIEYPDHTVPKKTFQNGCVKGLVVDLSGVKEQQFKGLLGKENLSFVYNSSEKTYGGTGYIVLSNESGKKQGEGQSDTFDMVCQTGKLSITS
jgi:hypothetical protein